MMSFFARPGTRIGILTNPYTDGSEFYTLIYERLGHPYSVLTGELVQRDPVYTHRSAYRIDLDALPPFLGHLLSS